MDPSPKDELLLNQSEMVLLVGRIDIQKAKGNLVTSPFNSTLGHPDAIMALGLAFPGESSKLDEGHGLKVEPVISGVELLDALDDAIEISKWNENEIKTAGWKAVHKNDIFSLYKRRVPPNNCVEYLMLGTLRDISPRTFLHSNINYDCRKKWDVTMHDMNVLGVPSGGGGLNCLAEDDYLDDGYAVGDVDSGNIFEDLLYYRTRWPWPLKDRDYTLARRCCVFRDRPAIVLISRSTDAPQCPTKPGVIRVDNYWCRSTFLPISTAIADSDNLHNGGLRSGLGEVSLVDTPGTTFITHFCDDQKVPLPPVLVDILSSQGEKVVPDSISRLHAVAKHLETTKQKLLSQTMKDN